MPPCLPPRRFRLSCADRAAAFFCAGARVDSSFPDVAQGAFPPDLFPAAGAHHLQGERAVERRVPFGGDLRFQGCKIVEARQHLFPGAVGAAAAVGARGDHRRVAVALFAPPPDGALAAVGDRLRRQGQIARDVPFVQQRQLPVLPAIRAYKLCLISAPMGFPASLPSARARRGTRQGNPRASPRRVCRPGRRPLCFRTRRENRSCAGR